MKPLASNQVRLSTKDRRFLAWSGKPDRRHAHIPKFSTLPRVDRRQYKCESCNKIFSSAELLKRHAHITHTGTKPVVCEICDRRFSTERHMLSHYNIHNEPRLEEFNVLMKRTFRTARSLPTSFTTVGSYVGVPKGLKTYVSEPTFKSFGTRQSFIVSAKNDDVYDDVNTKQAQKDETVFDYDQEDDTDVKRFMESNSNRTNINGRNIQKDEYRVKTKVPKVRSARRVEFSATSRQYSEVSSTSDIIRQVREAQAAPMSPSITQDDKVRMAEERVHRKLSHAQCYSARSSTSHYNSMHGEGGASESRTKLPSVSPNRNSQTQTRKSKKWTKANAVVKTSDAKESVSDSENDDVMPAIIRTSTPKSIHTKVSYSEAHRQLYSSGSAHFWDAPTGYSQSSPTRRMSGVTSVSGYDPYRNKSPKKSALKSVKSESFTDFL